MSFIPRLVDGQRAAWVACVVAAAAPLNASEKIAQAIRDSLPRYGPAQHAAAERNAKATESEPTPSSTVFPSKPTETAPSTPRGTNPDVVQLEPFTVRERRPKPAVKLPRLTAPEALRPGQNTTDPYLSPAERARRVRKKHLNVATSVLNPGFLGDAVAEAAEARERYAGKLGDLADQLELAAATGATPEEIRQLRELYLTLYMARPK